MKKHPATILTAFCIYFLVSSCNTATPQQYFEVAVLNANLFSGFSNEGDWRELASPPLKLVPGTKDQTSPMKRKEVLDQKIQFLEDNAARVKHLKETPDTKEMLDASKALYDLTIPVYKKEYQQLARLFDEGAPREQAASLAREINTTYSARFLDLYTRLIEAGKKYAGEHDIKVNWNISTSPH